MTTPTYPDLAGKSVFITGGGSGIGAALTRAFLEQGAKVAFVQRSDASGFVQQMEAETGTRPFFIQCDITNIDQLQGAIDSAAAEHGGLDVLVNNAANDQRHETLDVDEGFWDWAQAINLKAYFFGCQGALRHMGAGGSIINFSSISYMMGNAGYPAYTTANAGITGMTRSLAREFGPKGIRVNALAPGWVMTQKQRDMWVTETALAAHLDHQCLKTPLEPADIAGGVLFLASDAARAMTGQVMVIDGGVVTTG